MSTKAQKFSEAYKSPIQEVHVPVTSSDDGGVVLNAKLVVFSDFDRLPYSVGSPASDCH